MAKTSSKNSTKPRGRPVAASSEAARAILIETAGRLFAENGYEGTSLRQVAAGADVTPAMIAYYFKGKAGLLEAVVRDMLATLLGIVEEAVNSHPPGAFVPHLIRTYTGGISRAPWIPQILIREVISKDTPLRTLFVDDFAIHALRLVPVKVVAEMEEGWLRSDLDPRFSILSLVGMCLFPFIAHPVLGPLLNYQLDPEFGEVYGEHAVSLFLRCAGSEPEGVA